MIRYLLIALLITSESTSAQPAWDVIIKATPQLSWMLNETETKMQGFKRKTYVSTSFGIETSYHFNSNAGVGIEGLYSMQGQRFEEDGLAFTQRITYLKLPITFYYIANPHDKITLSGRLGPQLSILTGAKLKRDDYLVRSNAKEYFKDATFGGVAGFTAGYRLNTQWSLVAGLRYDFDFTNADNRRYYQAEHRDRTHNTTLGLELGLKHSFAL